MSIHSGFVDANYLFKLITSETAKKIFKNNPEIRERVRILKARLSRLQTAQGLAAIGSELFLALSDKEFLVPQNKQNPVTHANRIAYSYFTEKLSQHVVENIIAVNNSDVWLLSIEYWIAVAAESKKRGDFNSMHAIISALGGY